MSPIKRKTTHDNFVTEKLDIIENGLLGSYDARGNYFIAPQIVDELIHLRKKKKNSFQNSMFCVSVLPQYKDIIFELYFDKNTLKGKKAIATLFVLESVNKINGYMQNTIKTKLQDFEGDVNNFIEESYIHFNIKSYEDDEDEGMDKDDEEEKIKRDFLLAKKKFKALIKKLGKDKFLDAYGKYFASRMEVLTKMDNEFSSAVLDSFNSHYKMIETEFFKGNKDYKMLNELLDNSIEEFSGTNELFNQQEAEFNKDTEKAKDVFVDTITNQLEKDEAKAMNMLEKSDKELITELEVAEADHIKEVKDKLDKTESELADTKESLESTELKLENAEHTIGALTSEVREFAEKDKEEQEDEKTTEEESKEELDKEQEEKESEQKEDNVTQTQQENSAMSDILSHLRSEREQAGKTVNTQIPQQNKNEPAPQVSHMPSLDKQEVPVQDTMEESLVGSAQSQTAAAVNEQRKMSNEMDMSGR